MPTEADLTTVVRTMTIAAEPRRVYELACQMERYSGFMQDVNAVTVLQQGVAPDGRRWTITHWDTSVDGVPIYWWEYDLLDDRELRIEFRLATMEEAPDAANDMDRFEGDWTFEPSAGGTLVTLHVEFDFGIPELKKLIGPTLEIKVGENSEMMLAGMKAELEGRCTDGETTRPT
ncbi:SRPBCC family protein [Candidatus Berkelbacteria bacterium]|nr:SRPBCC family protein [Candidatus Berkelbacteria bacterium]